MTDIEFCENVAKRVWRWTVSRPTKYRLRWSYGAVDGGEYYNDQFICEVNSWQGFGRTVEAMTESGFTLDIDCIESHFSKCIGQDKDNEPIYVYGDCLFVDAGGIIKATHQAALDAVKGEG